MGRPIPMGLNLTMVRPVVPHPLPDALSLSGVAKGKHVDSNDGARRHLPLVEQYLREQADLTAVERFAYEHAQRHGHDAKHDAKHDDRGPTPAGERFYKALLPAAPPGEGQQYAFQVDLDVCTGCKACVTACHNLNGLDDGEAWRAVGLLHGGSAETPVQQSVTTACHHCLEPACMLGCPVGAYEKDLVTGIVKHLDDQCIGCQYCTLMCPYDVPQYDAKRGIVRKCDMCSDRLEEGEAPACVQACPNAAIAITIIDKRQAIEDAQGDAFLPGAPSPGITIPSTLYRTTRALPRNLLPANFYAVRPSPNHRPLVVMLVLIQLSVGAFWADGAVGLLAGPDQARAVEPLAAFVALVAAVAGLLALGASTLHLGRPLYAFRALIGLRTSWMSREILAFGIFAPLALAYAASLFHAPLLHLVACQPLPAGLAAGLQNALRGLVGLSGFLGLVCSVFIYHATRRAWWNGASTAFRFFMTAALLGTAVTLATALAIPLRATLVRPLVPSLLILSLAKASGELLELRHLGALRHTELKRSALLLTGDLGRYTVARFLALAMGGVALPLGMLLAPSFAMAACALALLIVGELLERTLFFAAVSPPGMPGGVGG